MRGRRQTAAAVWSEALSFAIGVLKPLDQAEPHLQGGAPIVGRRQ